MNPKKIKVAVFGGAGYLGSELCHYLVNLGYQVICIDYFWFGEKALAHLARYPNFMSYKVDNWNDDRLSSILSGMEAVINLAGVVGDPACELNPKFTRHCNYETTKLLAELTKKLKIPRFIFASSCSVYGQSNSDKLNEESEVSPLSLYAKDKLESEAFIRELSDSTFHPSILRLSTLFGWSQRMRFDLVVNLLTARACNGKLLHIYGGQQWRPFLHVRDAAVAFEKVLSADLFKVTNQIFNVGSHDNNLRIIDIARLISDHISSKIELEVEKTDKRDYQVDFSKISNVLNFKCDFTFTDAIIEIERNIRSKLIDFMDPLYNNAELMPFIINSPDFTKINKSSYGSKNKQFI